MGLNRSWTAEPTRWLDVNLSEPRDPEWMSTAGPHFITRPLRAMLHGAVNSSRQARIPMHRTTTDGRLFAAQAVAEEVATLLLAARANTELRDSFGNTPLFRAVFCSRGKGGVIGLLRQAGADPFAENSSGVSPYKLAHTIGNYDVAQFFADLPGP